MTKMINIPARLHSVEKGNIVAGASEIYDDTQAKQQNVINSDLISASSSMQAAIEAILLLIPSAASALNQLADKAFVNSSISTDTATFRGTYNLVSDLHLTVAATHAQIATALGTAISTADNNDYAFVQVPTADATPTEIKVTERYKFNGEAWAYEYTLNNSGFTSAQWAAINSGITAALVLKLIDLPTAAELATSLAAKANASEMSVTPGTGGNAGKTTIQLKSGTSATVLTDTLINVTYADLVTLRNGGNLVKGQFYRITDFVTTVNPSLTEVRSAGHAFDIIVQALDTDVLCEDAHAIQHAGDTYFQNSRLEAWQLKYSLDNDTTRFEWADSTNGKGVIWRMVDEHDNDVPYDFKNIQYKRYITENRDGIVVNNTLITNATNGHLTKRAVTTLALIYGESITYQNYAHYITQGTSENGKPVLGSTLSGTYIGYDLETTVAIDSNAYYLEIAISRNNYPIYIKLTNNIVWCYTFHQYDTENGSVDISLTDGKINANTIREWDEDGKLHLNKIVFCVYDTSQEYSIYNNLFGCECRQVTIGQRAINNISEGRLMRSTIGSGTVGNTFEETVTCIVCGFSFQNNVLRAQTVGIIAEYSFTKNICFVNFLICGHSITESQFVNSTLRVSLGDSIQAVQFFTVQDTSLGSNFNICHFVFVLNNKWGSNYVGISAFYIYHVTVDKDYLRDCTFEQNRYLTLTSNQTTSSSNVLKNIKVCQGVGRGTAEAGRVTISHDTVNDDFLTEYKPVNSVIVNV